MDSVFGLGERLLHFELLCVPIRVTVSLYAGRDEVLLFMKTSGGERVKEQWF